MHGVISNVKLIALFLVTVSKHIKDFVFNRFYVIKLIISVSARDSEKDFSIQITIFVHCCQIFLEDGNQQEVDTTHA